MKRVIRPYSVHVVFQHLNRVVRKGRIPVDEETVLDGTSTDRSGCRGRTFDADKTLHGSSNPHSVGVVACWTINVLHDDIANATVFESEIHLRDSQRLNMSVIQWSSKFTDTLPLTSDRLPHIFSSSRTPCRR
jgi:hypothetical protein